MGSLDVGTTKVCALVGELDSSGMVKVIGVGTSPCQGIHRGRIIDRQLITKAVEEAIIKAERMAGVTMPPVTMGISGVHCSSFHTTGSVAISRAGHRVRREDVQRVLEAAEAVSIPPGRRVLHRLVHYFSLDGKRINGEPVGATAHRLEAAVYLITAALSSLENLLACLQGASVAVKEVMVQSLAAAQAVLAPNDRELGVVLLDVGGGLTDVAVYRSGSLLHTATLPVGGQSLVQDLSVGMQLPPAEAEGYLRKLGCDPQQEVFLQTWNSSHTGTVDKLQLYTDIISARVEEIWQLVGEEIERSGGKSGLQAGIKLTGGGALIPGFAAAGARLMDMPVRTVAPTGVGGLTGMVSHPAYAVAVGLLQQQAGELWVDPQQITGRPVPPMPWWIQVRKWLANWYEG